ncbi:hypothetical protein P8452_49560 [Trifolium repens]|nr:hypothetical protein P8452_49560 [Trifolium repens]
MEENSKRKEALNLLGLIQSLCKSSSTTLKPSLASNNPFLFVRSDVGWDLIESQAVAQPQQGLGTNDSILTSYEV